MHRKLLVSFVCAGLVALVQPASIALAQHTGGGMPPGQSPSTPSTFPGSNAPGQNPDAAGQASPGATGPASPGATTPGAAKADDRKFVKEAAIGGLMEVQLGKLAQEKASDENIKQFGQKMVDDHTKCNDELKQAAAKDNIPVPSSLDPKDQAKIDKMSKLSGTAFDKAYVKDQVKDHEKDIREFQAEAQGGSDPNVKAFASSTVPVLQQHLQLAKNLKAGEKQTASNQH
ncbi:MAG: DUF4142 domain-containing protein [Acidobacteriaceae bacterium]|nr:DUF4142 domain-containing protein [Acidobacteriaceae bacterium]